MHPDVVITPNKRTVHHLDPTTWRQQTIAAVDEAGQLKKSCAQIRDQSEQLRASIVRQAAEQKEIVNNSIAGRVSEQEELIAKLETEIQLITDEESKLQTSEDKAQAMHAARQVPLKVAEGRMLLRSQRPLREQIRDDVEKALVVEASDVRDGLDQLANVMEGNLTHQTKLHQMRIELQADLDNQLSALEIDKSCLTVADRADSDASQHMAANEGRQLLRLTDPRFASQKSDKSPGTWKSETEAVIKRSQEARAASMRARKTLKRVINGIADSNQSTSSAVTESLLEQVAATDALTVKLSDQIQMLTLELESLQEKRQKVLEDIGAKESPIHVARQRLQLRRKRPQRESVRDAVEIALEKELLDLRQGVAQLQRKLDMFDMEEKRLAAAKKKLEDDLADKLQALELDKKCLEIDSDNVDRLALPSVAPSAAKADSVVHRPRPPKGRQNAQQPRREVTSTRKNTRRWPKYGFAKDPSIPLHVKRELLVHFRDLAGGPLVDNYKRPQLLQDLDAELDTEHAMEARDLARSPLLPAVA